MGKSIDIKTGHIIRPGSLPFRIRDFMLMFRVAHWVKNLFLYLPLFFAGEIFVVSKLLTVTLGVVAFSLVSSGVYIMNDYRDIDKDRLHPVKRHRAIAAGRISARLALGMMFLSLAAGLALALYLGYSFLLIVGSYLILNIFYSFGLKNISILDILIISVGFVFRVESGGVLAGVAISHWLVIMVFLLSLFLALGKRKDDLIVGNEEARSARKASSGYNSEFLNTGLAVTATIILMAYLMYTLSPEVIEHMGSKRIYYTTLFVGAGIMRYLQLVYIEKKTRSPVRILFEDRFIQVCIVLWVLSFYFLLYRGGSFHFMT